MTAEGESAAAGDRCYELRVRGELGTSFLANFESLEATVAPRETVIRGTLRDRAELHALLQRLELYGIELIEMHSAAYARERPHNRRRPA
jgi:hypothetical protein